MKKNEDGGKKLPTSFTVGAIALIFLAIGYQTALFVLRVSRARIEAGMDSPDTVYVYAQPGDRRGGSSMDSRESTTYGHEGSTGNAVSGDGYRDGNPGSGYTPGKSRKAGGAGNGITPGSIQEAGSPDGGPANYGRRNAAHSAAVSSVRASVLERRPPENFPFDPNTATIEDFVRLGFTRRQAEAIDRYRTSGGRFRRKEDFARSYVVEDSVYERLSPWIRIPRTDINKADSAAFDALPGIGPYFASKMVAYRKRLGGYSFAAQLLEIPKFREETFAAIEDLIEAGECEPYRLWSLPEDSLRTHPYIGAHSAQAIVLYRENNPRDRLTVEGLAKAGILSAENAEKLSRCRIALPQ
ncbi:MAG: ComEA family DNA-binding protein [Candidatus Cryptobacteroides sp.]